MNNQLAPAKYYKFSIVRYLCYTLGISPRIVTGILLDKYIPGGRLILSGDYILANSNSIIKSYNNYLRLVKAEKDEFDTDGQL